MGDRRRVGAGGELGQAAVEWVATIGAVALALSAALAFLGPVDGRALGGVLAHRLVCAVRADCAERDGDAALVRAYGERDAALVRRHLPGLVFEPGERQLPVDWRRCRQVACASVAEEDADGDRDLHVSEAGRRATVFTRLVRRGSRTYVQYWAYYPDSNTTWAASDRLWRGGAKLLRLVAGMPAERLEYPGFHRDDWEGVAVRVERDGHAATRATSHGHWQWCRHTAWCEGRWGPVTGWSRVSRGSHAGHVPVDARTSQAPRDRRLARGEVGLAVEPLLPGAGLSERTASPDAIRLVPLETLPRGRYRRLDPDIAPPWRKDAYRDPESDAS